MKVQRNLHSMKKKFYSKTSEFFRETLRTKLVPSANNNSSEGLRTGAPCKIAQRFKDFETEQYCFVENLSTNFCLQAKKSHQNKAR